MKFSIDRSILLKALGHTQTVVERRTVTPILANVLLEAQKGCLKISATDLDLSLIEKVPAQVAEEGATTVSAHLFYDIVRKLPDDAPIEITEKTDSGLLSIRSGKSKFSLPTLTARDFAQIKTAGLPHTFVMEAKDLHHLIISTRFSMSTEDSRYYLNGIYFHTKEGDQRPVLRAVATDGHRLALAEVDQPQEASGMPDVIIPKKTIFEISKLLEEKMGEIQISLSLTQIIFNFGNVIVVSRLIDGAFPDYEKIIPVQNSSLLTVSRKQLFDAVDRVSTVSSEKTRGVKFFIEPKAVTVSASAHNQSSGTEECEATYDGKPLETGFNARYLLDITQQIQSDTMEFKLSGQEVPAIIRGLDRTDVFYVLMPMRV